MGERAFPIGECALASGGCAFPIGECALAAATDGRLGNSLDRHGIARGERAREGHRYRCRGWGTRQAAPARRGRQKIGKSRKGEGMSAPTHLGLRIQPPTF